VGRRLGIDGAPSRADFQLFMARLGAALDATLAQPEKFTRFAERVGAADPVALRWRIEARAAHLRRLAAGNWTPEPYGHGRLDAFGHILNAVAGDALNDTGNYRAPDAPVSYPFLWTAPHQRYAQWNGIAGNPIGRNLGEVLGVFGEVSLAGPEAERFRSSALAENLLRLETWVEELKAPPWPAWSVGQPDAVRVERGRTLYREHCQACHGGVPYRYTPADENLFGKRFIDVAMIPRHVVGTDSRMLDNFTRRRVETSLFAEAGQPAPEIAAGEFLTKVVGKTVERDFAAREVKEEERAAYFGHRLGRDGTPQPGWMGPPAYKAGPLAGIWATGPFLHNGSVPTLYDLLGPEDERPAVFWTGSTRFDPVKVGFVSEEAGLSAQERARLFRFDTSRPGNSNRGHAYPRGQPLDHEERLDLIAFLKTLEDPDVPR
ncbi:MAG TPA: di-heme-cytochrome C peroxidase, partial [Arenibaculum sp.]|nr:di-heme-cytochrome C peroxidase [Arenibaculum sp.]